MKKLFLVFAFLGLFTFLTPKIADAAEQGCYDIYMTCPNTGVTHLIVICDSEDWEAWKTILCGNYD